jgi:23S rRNA pseudouridine2605 synthase
MNKKFSSKNTDSASIQDEFQKERDAARQKFSEKDRKDFWKNFDQDNTHPKRNSEKSARRFEANNKDVTNRPAKAYGKKADDGGFRGKDGEKKDFKPGRKDFNSGDRGGFKSKDSHFGPKRESGNRDADRGDRKDFKPRDRDFGPKREFGNRDDRGDRKDFKSRDRDFGPKREYGNRDSDRGDRKDFKPRDRDFGPKREFGNRDADRGDRKDFKSRDRDFGPKREFGNRDSDRGDRKDFKPRDRDFGPKREFGNRDADRGDRKDFKSRDRDFGPKREFGNRDADRGDRKDFKPRDRDFGPKREFGNRDSDRGDRKDFKPRDRDFGPKREFGNRDSDRGDRKDFKSRDRDFKGEKGGPKDRPFKREHKRPEDAFKEHFDYEHPQAKAYDTNGNKGVTTEQQTPSVATEAMPLNKYIAHCGVCSRRDAVELIKEGKVTVNSKVVMEPGLKINSGDIVQMEGKELKVQKNLVYVLLNKPKGFITTTDDPKGRKTVMDIFGDNIDERVFPVGRLDRNTTGLLLLTNDGDVAQQLSHPKYENRKIYQVTLNKNVAANDFEKILGGLELEDGVTKVDQLAYLEQKNEIGIEIHSGKNRIVRRIFEHLGYEVEKLDRVMYAGLTKKNLKRGQWRFLTKQEIINLKHLKR